MNAALRAAYVKKNLGFRIRTHALQQFCIIVNAAHVCAIIH